MAAVAPMELVKSDPSTIPLKCTLCPKRPNFSDVSHLLTHISSKSHLSHRFKTELKALSEPECQERVRVYEEWYERHGIRALLAERMSTKDQKPAAKRGRPAQTQTSQTKASAAPKRNNSIKIEAEDSSTPSYSPNWSTNSQAVLPFRGAHRPANTEYLDRSDRNSPAVKRSLSDDYSAPSTPDTMSGTMSGYGSQRWPSESTGDMGPAQSYHTDRTAHYHVVNVESPPEDERSKLKGVRYPGMGLFDSASEQDRKKRNQKKDASVLVRMEETSCGIEPLENIWEADGELQRTRDIYASPSPEGTPERELEETAEQRAKRVRRNPPKAPSVVQTRSSARIAQYSNGSGKKHNRNRNAEADHSGHGHFHSQPLDGYDVFQARRGPGHGGENLGHGASPDVGGRHALSSLNSNMAIGESHKSTKPHQRFSARAGEGPVPFSSHPAVASGGYFNQPGSLNSSFNPLYVEAANRNGMFHPGHSYNYGQRFGPGSMAPGSFDGYTSHYSPSGESPGPFQHAFPPPPRSGNDNFDMGN